MLSYPEWIRLQGTKTGLTCCAGLSQEREQDRMERGTSAKSLRVCPDNAVQPWPRRRGYMVLANK